MVDSKLPADDPSQSVRDLSSGFSPDMVEFWSVVESNQRFMQEMVSQMAALTAHLRPSVGEPSSLDRMTHCYLLHLSSLIHPLYAIS